MTLEEEILNDVANQLANQIDTQVLKGMGYVFDYYLEHGRGTICGQEYLSVAPMNADGQWHDMMEWMVNSFGPTPFDSIWMPDQRWHVNNAKFWFRDAKDRDWFVLRWS
jgi:hypothetical protein